MAGSIVSVEPDFKDKFDNKAGNNYLGYFLAHWGHFPRL